MSDRVEAYSPDRSPKGKFRRRFVRLLARRPARMHLSRPMLSFTFDDPAATAITIGAKLLETRGLRGTFFVAAGLAGREGPMGRYASREEIVAVSDRGHEVGCHTYSHMDCGRAISAAIGADVDRNAATLRMWGLPKAVSFAYPYGDVSAAAKQVLGRRFEMLRALHKGFISDGSDLHQAPAVGIEGPTGEAEALAWLDRACERRGWLILYTHDIADQPSLWGCTAVALTRLIDAGIARGFDIVTIAEGLRRIAPPVADRRPTALAAAMSSCD
jgi:Predicted xylanase/chitin deacetylase